MDAPAAVGRVPARAHRPEVAPSILDVEHVGAAVREENALLTAGLLGKQVPQTGERGLLGLGRELGADVLVERITGETVDPERCRRNVLLDLAKKVALEVITQPADGHRGLLAGVLLEVIGSGELPDAGNFDDGHMGQDGLGNRSGFRLDRDQTEHLAELVPINLTKVGVHQVRQQA